MALFGKFFNKGKNIVSNVLKNNPTPDLKTISEDIIQKDISTFGKLPTQKIRDYGDPFEEKILKDTKYDKYLENASIFDDMVSDGHYSPISVTSGRETAYDAMVGGYQKPRPRDRVINQREASKQKNHFELEEDPLDIMSEAQIKDKDALNIMSDAQNSAEDSLLTSSSDSIKKQNGPNKSTITTTNNTSKAEKQIIGGPQGSSIETNKKTQNTYGLDQESFDELSSSQKYRLKRAYGEQEEATKAAQEWTEKVRDMDSKDWTKEYEEQQKAIIKRQQNAQEIYDKMVADPTTISPGVQDYILGNPKTTAGVLGGGALGYLALNLSSSRGQLTNQQLYGQEDLI